jgi:hypothetical protein
MVVLEMSLKQRLFQLGFEAGRKYIDNEDPGYVCPICLGIFRDPKALTLEHVPPAAVGGKVLCLLCKPCNNRSGHSMDAALHERAEAAQVLRTGKTGRFLKLKIDKLALNGTIKRKGDGLEVQVAAGQNDPARVEEFQHRRNSEPGAQIQVWYPHRFNDHSFMVGYLKVAYLYAFAKFGYGYILGPCLESVRLQIREPDKKTIWKWWLGRGDDLSHTMLYLIDRPLSCIAVAINEHVIVLPGLEPCDHYEKIEQLTQDTPPDKLLEEFHSTHAFAAPTTMELLLDQGPS